MNTAQQILDSFHLKITEEHAKEILLILDLELAKANREGFKEARDVLLTYGCLGVAE